MLCGVLFLFLLGYGMYLVVVLWLYVCEKGWRGGGGGWDGSSSLHALVCDGVLDACLPACLACIVFKHRERRDTSTSGLFAPSILELKVTSHHVYYTLSGCEQRRASLLLPSNIISVMFPSASEFDPGLIRTSNLKEIRHPTWSGASASATFSMK